MLTPRVARAQDGIFLIRGQNVMLSTDLADLYEVEPHRDHARIRTVAAGAGVTEGGFDMAGVTGGRTRGDDGTSEERTQETRAGLDQQGAEANTALGEPI